ncbi:hypothetical protein [Methylopila sp. 73B]|uniref:hypothetical protein n=1 Tax=Methylopila sp. 73B TaxID=1120792 RepID=UPI001FD97D72|nr:hypothetical protein [Methylopila sp. 73B]
MHYEGDIVTFRGATYQAGRDTANDPSHEDWTCIAERGHDGQTFQVRGTFEPSSSYSRFDVVALNSSSFVALRDAPGACPGDGWQALAMGGRRGEKGPAGERGLQGIAGRDGMPGASIVGWETDLRGYVATPIMSDGSLGPQLEVRVFLERFLEETGR